MIKTFITKTSADHSLASFLSQWLDQENIGLEIFVWDEKMRCGDNAQGMMDEVRSSIIYIPIISDASLKRPFVVNEIRAAVSSESVNVFPVRTNLSDSSRLPDGIRIESHQDGTAEGLICPDFSERHEWEIKYEELREAIVNRLLELGLYHRDESFYQDAETIDHILARARPTASEIRIMVDVYLRKHKFQEYVFRKLERSDWLKYLYHYNFFSGSRNPRPVEVPEQTGYYTIPYWPALDYLLRLAASLSEVGDPDMADTLLRVVRSVSEYREDQQRIDNYHTDSALVEIMAALPIEMLDLNDMDYIGTYLDSRWSPVPVAAQVGESLLPRLLQENATGLVARVLEIAIDFREYEQNRRKQFVSVMDDFWLQDLIDKNGSAIGELLPIESATILLRKIREILQQDRKQFNAIQIPSVEEHPQNRLSPPYQLTVVGAARDFLDSAAKQEIEETRSLLQSLLTREHQIFPRIALNCISKHWVQYSDLFWPLLEEELLTQVWLKHELYELFKANHIHFSQQQMEQVLCWIETRDYYAPREGFVDEAHQLRRRAGQKLEWLTALKETEYQPARDKYIEYLAIAGAEPEHPGFSTWMSDVQVGSISPVEVNELLQKDNGQIATYLREYRDTGDWYGVPSKEGLADAFKAAVTAQPQKFVEDLGPFLDLPPYYLYYLLWGLNEAWKAKHDFDWALLLVFCLKLTRKELFWTGPPRDDAEYPGSLVTQVADLIKAGTQDDAHVFDSSLLPLAEELLISLLDRAPSELWEGYDILTAVLNSPKGRALSAAVNHSLRYARLRKDEDASVRWPLAIKEDFTRRLDRQRDDTREFSATAGQYLANLYWLDKEWVISHIDDIFPKDNEKHWRAAMAGYFWVGPVYRYLFLLLREHGHYAKALKTDFDDENLRERLVRHIMIAYLRGDELLGDSDGLLGGLVDNSATPDMHKAVTYLWMQQGALEGAQRERVLAFWRRLVAQYEDRDDLSEEERALVVDLAKLAAHLDSLEGEAVGWLKLSVRYFRTEQDAWFLIEYLEPLVQDNPEEAGVVYLEILDNGVYPAFRQKHIVPIVRALYERGQGEAADRICNLYGDQGIHFLRETYERYHSEDQDDALE